jgi:hypothetical protein
VSQFTDFFEAAILNWFRGTTFPAATGSVYASLHTSATADDGTGTEVSGNAYARQGMTKAAGTWTAPAAAGVISNTAAVVFPAATPAGWGTVTHGALQDAVTAGNMVMHGPLGTSKLIGIGDVFQYAIGALTITVA